MCFRKLPDKKKLSMEAYLLPSDRIYAKNEWFHGVSDHRSGMPGERNRSRECPAEVIAAVVYGTVVAPVQCFAETGRRHLEKPMDGCPE